MLRVTIVLAMLVLGISDSRADHSDVEQCRALFTKPGFDCACVTGFMEPRLSPTEREIVLKFWAVSLDRDRLRAGLLEELYRRHGSPAITTALFRFNLIGVRLLMACPSSQPDGDYGF
jgi:hypothetical protein